MKLETLITERLAELTANDFEAVHTSGGSLTENQRRSLEMEDPTESWGGTEKFDVIDMAYGRDGVGAGRLIAEIDADELAEMIDEKITSEAESQFVAWCNDQEWFGRCPTRTIDDVCVHII